MNCDFCIQLKGINVNKQYNITVDFDTFVLYNIITLIR